MISLVAIKDFAEFIRTGKTPSTKETQYFDGEIQWFTPGDLDTVKHLSSSKRTLTKLAFSDKKAACFPPNTLLVSCIGDIAKLGITTEVCSSNQQITGIKPNNDVDVDYLYYWFKQNKKFLQNYANNAVVPILNNRSLEQIQIPLPPLAEQKQIAAILDAADNLRQKDQQLVEHYTALSQSLFLEMFGDVFLNIKHYPKATFRELLDKVQIGPFGSQLHKHDYVENGVPLINPVHIIQSKVLPSNSFSILKEKYDSLPNYHLKNGDLIMARRGEMGRCALITKQEEGYICGTGSLYLRPNGNVNSTFLLHVITSDSGKSYLERNAQGVTMMNLNKKIILNVEIGLPPIELQNQFEVAINLIEKQKQQAQANLQKSEALFNSLLQRAFTGELTADKAA